MKNEQFQELFDFVALHSKDNPAELRLKYASYEPRPEGFSAIDQIECRRRTTSKIPGFIASPDFLFPSVIASEQCTAEAVAAYHTDLIPAGASVADLTAGLGIDAFSLASKASQITLFERNPLYCRALRHNAEALGLTNVEVINADSMLRLAEYDVFFDTLFIDPARRSSSGARTYAFADCEPDILGNLPLLLSRCKRLIIKSSPMLDLAQIRRELPFISALHIVSLRGECKEILIDIQQLPRICSPETERETESDPKIHAVDIDAKGRRSVFSIGIEDCGVSPASYFDFTASPTPRYLYEPNASMMKASPWEALCCRHLGLKKIAPSTHLYVCDTLYPDFPGRVLEVSEISDRKMSKSLRGSCMNAVCRNYPLKADEVTREMKLKGSDTEFLYCFRDNRNKSRRLRATRLKL